MATTKFVAPFEIQPIAIFTQEELSRREQDYGFNYVNSSKAGWDSRGNWNTYKGPMTSWVRICSNGIGPDEYGAKQGFVMHGVNGFYKDYGFDPVTKAKTQTVLGFTPDGIEHVIPNEYEGNQTRNKHVPPPGIISIDATMKKELYREVIIKWKCYSIDHLNYLTPYFLSPTVSMFIEWGWNHFNPQCLLDLTNIGKPSQMKSDPNDKTPGPPGPKGEPGDPDDPRVTKGTGLLGIYTDPFQQQTNIEKGKGLYELTCGIITNFEYTLQEDGSYECITTVASNSMIYSGVQVRSNGHFSYTTETNSKGEKKPNTIKNLKEYINTTFNTIPGDMLNGLNKPSEPTDFRVFIPRNKYADKDPRGKGANASSASTYSFDRSGTDDFWISMGYFVDKIINVYCSGKSKIGDATFNKLDISATWINGHKNLITTDGKVLLIPNSQAPCISPSVQDRGNSKLYTTPEDEIKRQSTVGTIPDKTLQDNLHSTARQDLDEIINYFRQNYGKEDKSKTEFPSVSYQYYAGKLENLYIHKNLVIDAVNKADTVIDVLNFVLNKMSEAANKFWTFQVIQYGDSNSLLTIIDTKYMSTQRMKELFSQQRPGNDSHPYLYYFKNRASKNIIQSMSFNVKMSDKVAAGVLYGGNNSQVALPENPFPFITKDRFFNTANNPIYFLPKDEKEKKKQQNDEIKKKRMDGKLPENLQKEKDATDGAFIYGEVYDDTSKTYIRKLALTQKDMLVLLTSDNDPKNISVNSFPQPGITVEITLLGIAGFKTFQVFGIDNLPAPYSQDVLFQVNDVKHSLQKGTWTTTLTTSIRPIKDLNISV